MSAVWWFQYININLQGMAEINEYWSQLCAHLVYLPISYWLNLVISSRCKNQNSQKYSTMKISQFEQMLYVFVNSDFWIMKKLWDLVHEKLVNKQGQGPLNRWAQSWDQHSWNLLFMYILKSANHTVGGKIGFVPISARMTKLMAAMKITLFWHVG